MIKVYLVPQPVKELFEYKYQRLECEHKKVFAKKTCSNGAIQLREQCTLCGETFGNLPKTAYRGNVNLLPEIDDSLARETRKSFYEGESELRERMLQKHNEDFNRKWWAWYNGYLQSNVWKERRKAVLERDNYQCRACGAANATQAHHISYKHVGREPLFELEAVCDDCHKQLTEMDRNL